jgi:hypothetical protein
MVALMADEALDAEKIRLLDQWATGLQHDERPEVAAAGRAIVMLVEEVERLHVHLWDQKLNASREVPEAVAPALTPEEPIAGDHDLARSLRGRLRARWGGSAADA